MERLIMGALKRGAALENLARYGDARAIFFRMAPGDGYFSGAQFPRCIFDWQPEAAGPIIGRLIIDIVALNECARTPEALASGLRAELDGMIFGGQTARALKWRQTQAFTARSNAYTVNGLHEPQCIGASMLFDAYEFDRPGGLGGATERALISHLGGAYMAAYDASPEGELPGSQPVCASPVLSSAAKSTAACRWCEFETVVRLPGATETAARGAFERLSDLDRLDTDLGGVLISNIRFQPDADGFGKGQIILRGKYNALTAQATAQTLNGVKLRRTYTKAAGA